MLSQPASPSKRRTTDKRFTCFLNSCKVYRQRLFWQSRKEELKHLLNSNGARIQLWFDFSKVFQSFVGPVASSRSSGPAVACRHPTQPKESRKLQDNSPHNTQRIANQRNNLSVKTRLRTNHHSRGKEWTKTNQSWFSKRNINLPLCKHDHLSSTTQQEPQWSENKIQRRARGLALRDPVSQRDDTSFLYFLRSLW